MNYTEKEYSEWSEYDSITQSYRSNMIASQSLLLTVAAIFYDKNSFLVTLVCIIGFIHQWYIWFRVITSRTIISDYHKFNAKFDFSKKINSEGYLNTGTQSELTEEIYVSNATVRKVANHTLAEITGQKKYRTNWRTTRIKLDLIIPLTFTAIWIGLIIFTWK